MVLPGAAWAGGRGTGPRLETPSPRGPPAVPCAAVPCQRLPPLLAGEPCSAEERSDQAFLEMGASKPLGGLAVGNPSACLSVMLLMSVGTPEVLAAEPALP